MAGPKKTFGSFWLQVKHPIGPAEKWDAALWGLPLSSNSTLPSRIKVLEYREP